MSPSKLHISSYCLVSSAQAVFWGLKIYFFSCLEMAQLFFITPDNLIMLLGGDSTMTKPPAIGST